MTDTYGFQSLAMKEKEPHSHCESHDEFGKSRQTQRLLLVGQYVREDSDGVILPLTF